jgi:hypothetical protein
MNLGKVAALGFILLASRFTFADASYQETTQITGGSMVAPLKSMSFLSKSMRDMLAPTTTTTMIHGNQKAVVSKDFTEITDLDKETVTHIDNLHKTYTVVTFVQMRQAFQQMPKQMQQAQDQAKQAQQQQPQQPKSDLKTSFDVSVKNTGVSKEINGLTAQEQLVTLQMHVTDPNAPPTQTSAVTYVVTTDAWISPDPPEVKEIQDFDKRFGQKLIEGVDLSAFKAQMTQMHDMSQNPGMSQMFAGKPGSAEAMAEMGKLPEWVGAELGPRVRKIRPKILILPLPQLPPIPMARFRECWDPHWVARHWERSIGRRPHSQLLIRPQPLRPRTARRPRARS